MYLVARSVSAASPDPHVYRGRARTLIALGWQGLVFFDCSRYEFLALTRFAKRNSRYVQISSTYDARDENAMFNMFVLPDALVETLKYFESIRQRTIEIETARPEDEVVALLKPWRSTNYLVRPQYERLKPGDRLHERTTIISIEDSPKAVELQLLL